jgi:hypothetical protein
LFTFIEAELALIPLLRGLLALIPLFEGVAVTLFVTDGVVAFDLPSQKGNFYYIYPFEEGELNHQKKLGCLTPAEFRNQASKCI